VRRAAESVGRHRQLPKPLVRAIDIGLAPEPLHRPSVGALTALLEQVPGVVSPRSRRPASDVEGAGDEGRRGRAVGG
jgi:hypothetical protein